jgi:transcriptional regulator with XRE-family HTH domain
MKVFGERLKKLRQNRNMTQAELGNIYDPKLAQSTIGTYENGLREMSYTNLLRTAEYFSTTVSYLLGETDELRPDTTEEIKDNSNDLKEFLKQNQILFNGAELSEEDKKRMIDILTGLFWENFTK